MLCVYVMELLFANAGWCLSTDAGISGGARAGGGCATGTWGQSPSSD